MRARVVLLVVWVVVFGGPSRAAHAQAAPPDSAAEARRHFEAGTRMFAKGRLNEALVEFETANRIKPDPALLYDLAETHRALGHDASALAFYRAFLEAAPYTAKREEVDAKIHLLLDTVQRRDSELHKMEADTEARQREAAEANRVAQQLASVAAMESARAAEAQKAAREAQARADRILATQTTPPLYKRWWLWTIVGAVAAAGVVTTVVLTSPQTPSTNQGSFAF